MILLLHTIHLTILLPYGKRIKLQVTIRLLLGIRLILLLLRGKQQRLLKQFIILLGILQRIQPQLIVLLRAQPLRMLPHILQKQLYQLKK